MYEFIILAQLLYGPAHGYLIASIINDMIGPFARISNGRLYPLLAKLQQGGLIEIDTETPSAQQGDRQLRAYKITETGRTRFHELIMDTSMHPGEYQKIFQHKVAYFDQLKPTERLRLIEHYANYSQTHLLHLQAEADDVVRDMPNWRGGREAYREQSIIGSIQHMIHQWQLEFDWAKSLREHELALAAESESTPKATQPNQPTSPTNQKL